MTWYYLTDFLSSIVIKALELYNIDDDLDNFVGAVEGAEDVEDADPVVDAVDVGVVAVKECGHFPDALVYLYFLI